MMARKLVDGEERDLSPAEEARRTAEEARWAAGATTRAKMALYPAARRAAIEHYMTELAKDPDAPQAVRDWDAA